LYNISDGEEKPDDAAQVAEKEKVDKEILAVDVYSSESSVQIFFKVLEA